VLREMNGYRVEDGAPLASAVELGADGSTACGTWIHCGIFPAADRNLSARRERGGRNHPRWGFAWPANRRVLYNRASADREGRPWSERKRLLAWEDGRWTGDDVPDLPASAGQDAPPFVMLDEGLARLYVPRGLADGPLPTHYEPVESPVRDNALHRRRANPAHKVYARGRQRLAEPGEFPYALTTYRLTEHYLTGVMSRWLPWLAELQPAAFCEIPPALAAQKGVRTGDKVRVTTPRGSIVLKALVTERLPTLGGVPVVGIPWHFGFKGLVRGPVVNDLSAMVGDPNVFIQETKAMVCDLEKA
jgi:formate dehydrogenase major subunit